MQGNALNGGQVMATQRTRSQLSRNSVWIRGLFMIVFMFAFGIAEMILALIAIVQFLWLLLHKEPNVLLVNFGKSLAFWLADVAAYQCCATEQKPFPWDDWPSSEDSDSDTLP
jgi:hypothetical protein